MYELLILMSISFTIKRNCVSISDYRNMGVICTYHCGSPTLLMCYTRKYVLLIWVLRNQVITGPSSSVSPPKQDNISCALCVKENIFFLSLEE